MLVVFGPDNYDLTSSGFFDEMKLLVFSFKAST